MKFATSAMALSILLLDAVLPWASAAIPPSAANSSPPFIAARSQSRQSAAAARPRPPAAAQPLAARSHGLARDLRTAFDGLVVGSGRQHSTRQRRQLLPRQQQILGGTEDGVQKNLYCTIHRPGEALNSASGGGGGGSNSPAGPNGHSGSSVVTTTGTRTGLSLTLTSTPTPSLMPTSPWKIIERHEGTSFFDGWTFFPHDDPTEGTVDYASADVAWGSNLVEFNDRGNVVMRVDTSDNISGRGRQSIRLQSKLTFNSGLVIIDAVHVPTGCGTWGAFWTSGPEWPAGGEIDIVEGVHDYTNNQATVHTDVGCTLPSADSSQLGMTGTLVDGTDCSVYNTGNRGCGVRAPTNNTFGKGFNANGGGVYAMILDSSGVAVYFFPAGGVPADIEAEILQPQTWGLPQARWPTDKCDPTKFFSTQTMILDTTFCGTWAGAVWGVGGIPGQEQSCAQRTGVSSCDEFVRGKGSSFIDAYWEIKSIKFYQHM